MPSNRNDITRKPIYSATPDKPRWVVHDRVGNPHIIWADSEEEARQHAIDNDWHFPKTGAKK